MMNRQIIKYFSFFLGCSLAAVNLTALAQQHQHSNEHLETTSPYVEQLDSPVKGLSSEEVDELLNGKGAGYARMAELNGYPGPRHLLDLSSQLNLSAQQTKEIQAVFDRTTLWQIKKNSLTSTPANYPTLIHRANPKIQ